MKIFESFENIEELRLHWDRAVLRLEEIDHDGLPDLMFDNLVEGRRMCLPGRMIQDEMDQAPPLQREPRKSPPTRENSPPRTPPRRRQQFEIFNERVAV